MKIRGDFVTNSSSGSFVALQIQSGVLAELLASVNSEKNTFHFEILEDSETVRYKMENCGFSDWRPPKSIDGIVTQLIDGIEAWIKNELWRLDHERRDQMEKILKKEKKILSKNAETILADIESAGWQHGLEVWGEGLIYPSIEADLAKLKMIEGLSDYPKFMQIIREFWFDKDAGGEYRKKCFYEPAGETAKKTVDLDVDDPEEY